MENNRYGVTWKRLRVRKGTARAACEMVMMTAHHVIIEIEWLLAYPSMSSNNYTRRRRLASSPQTKAGNRWAKRHCGVAVDVAREKKLAAGASMQSIAHRRRN